MDLINNFINKITNNNDIIYLIDVYNICKNNKLHITKNDTCLLIRINHTDIIAIKELLILINHYNTNIKERMEEIF